MSSDRKSLKERIIFRFFAWVDELGQTAWAKRIFRRLDFETEERKALGIHAPPPGGFRRFALSTLAAGILAFFVYQVSYYLEIDTSLNKNPDVWNLTQAKVKWNVSYGHSPSCGVMPCWLSPRHLAQKQMVLPAREFPLKDLKPKEKVYLSTTLTLPPFLLESKKPLTLYSLYIWADKYNFYLDGEPIHSGVKETVFISIPPALLKPTMQLAFEIDPGGLPYQGLANKHDLYLGPRDQLLRYSFSSQEYLTTYHLWFLLPQLMLCIFFASLYLGFYQYREIFYLIAYLCFGTLDTFVRSGYFPEALNSIIPAPLIADQVTSLLARIALLTFIHEYFRRYSRTFNFLIRAVFIFTLISLPFFIWWDDFRNLANNTRIYFNLNSILSLGALFYGVILSGLTAFYLSNKRISGIRSFISIGLYMTFVALLITNVMTEQVFGAKYPDLSFFKNLSGLVLTMALACATLIEFGLALPQRNLIKGLMSRFVNQRVTDEILRSDQFLKPKRISITTLVIDLRGFSRLCEVLEPDQVVEKLIQFRNQVSGIINQRAGYLDKFMGDGALVLFGAYEKNRDSVSDALYSAFWLIRDVNISNQHALRCPTGVAVTTGYSIVGAIGSTTKTEYSAVGHPVNLAFRMEKLTKALGHPLLMDAETFEKARPRILACEFTGVRVEGMETAVSLYGLVALRDEEGEWQPLKSEWKESVARAQKPGLIDASELKPRQLRVA